LTRFIGGWQTAGVWRFDDGQPVMVSLAGTNQPLPVWPEAGLEGTPQLNPIQVVPPLDQGGGYFAIRTCSEPAAYTIGSAPEPCRGSTFRHANANLSLFKQFSLKRVREGAHLELRTEWFNAFNHPQFAGPNTSVGRPARPASGRFLARQTCRARYRWP